MELWGHKNAKMGLVRVLEHYDSKNDRDAGE